MNKKNLILVGFMGSGKTVIGRQTARLLDYEFADTDEEIRNVTGLELPVLYRKYGEIRFRSEERLVIARLAARERLVIACGGSLPPTLDNLRLLRENGWFALLTADTDVISSRLKRKGNHFLSGGKPNVEQITAQAEAWEQAYTDFLGFRLDSGKMSVEDAAQALADAFLASTCAKEN